MKIPDSGRPKTHFFAGWSNLFTYGLLQSILAFSFYAACCLALDYDFSRDYGFLIIIGTLGIYNLHLLIKTFLEEKRLPVFQAFSFPIISITALYILFNFESGIVYLEHLLIPVIISILYLLPISRIMDSRFIPGWIKPVSLALSWTWICVGPIINLDIHTSFFISSIFFFILTNALMFDIKDIETDKRINISTFAITFGGRITQYTAIITLLMSMVLLACFYKTSYSGTILAPLILGLYFIPLRNIKIVSPQDHYYWYLDGGLFLFPFAVYLIHLVSDKL